MVGVPEFRIDQGQSEPVIAATLCPHLKKGCRFRRIEPKIRDLKSPTSRVCKTCVKTVSKSSPAQESAQLWLCLGCGNLFCGRYDKGHAASHHDKMGDADCLMWNIESHSCWCYICDDAIRYNDTRNEILSQVEKYWEKHAENRAAVTTKVPVADTKDFAYRTVSPGFQNLGNTCFFNSVLQLLGSVEQLHEIVSPHPYRERSLLEITSSTGFTISFTKVLNEIYASEKEKAVVKPTSLFGELHRKFPRFTKGAQQDAQELLHYLLEGLKSDEMAAKNEDRPELQRTRSRRKTTGEEEFEMTDCKKDADTKNQWMPNNYIESIFEGRLASIVVCSACKSISTTYDQFGELSLSIVQEKPQLRERKSRFRAAIDDIGRKGRSSLSMTRASSTRRTSSSAMARSSSKESEDTENNTRARSPRFGRQLLGAGTSPIPISMSEAVSEEEMEDSVADKQLKSPAFSMSDAKSRLERLSFAFSKRPTSPALSSADITSASTKSHVSALSSSVNNPPPSIERLQYIERLMMEPENTELRGSIQDSLRDFTAVETLEQDNAFACEECAKLMYSPRNSPEIRKQSSFDSANGGGSPSAMELASNQTGPYSATSSSSMDRDCASEVEASSGLEPMDIEEERETAVVEEQGSAPRTPVKVIEKPKYIMRKAYKRFLVADLPSILILHLKRFQQSGKSVYSSMRKNDAIVQFDQELDMSPYLMPEADASVVKASTRYRCIGAIVHIGTINSGHYVAYFLTHKVTSAGEPLSAEVGSKGRQWVFASDALTRPCSWAEVSKSRAYMLWYERV